MYPDALIAELRVSPRPAPRYTFFWLVAASAERIVALLALVLLSPIWFAVATAITVLSGESPMIAVLRAGRFGKPLWLFKFRTMWSSSGSRAYPWKLVEHVVDERGPARKDSSDIRVTSGFARFCRRFSLDEIPQLLNVVAGEMSLVAPRPLTGSELSEHYGQDAAEVLSVRPGITGLWQVSGRNALTYAERRRLDVILVRTLTPKLYLRILLRTIPVVLTGSNSW